MKLPAQWTIYEKYFQENKKNYKASFVKILSIDTVQELSFLKKETIYLKPMEIFYEHEEQKVKIFNRFNEDNKEEVVIDALFYFKYDIQPEWEDARNKNGGELQLEINAQNIKKLDEFFLDLFLEIAGQSNSVYEQVNGIRLIDKLRPGIKVHVRCDLWIGFDPKEQENSQQRQILVDMLNRLLKEFQLSADMKDISHK